MNPLQTQVDSGILFLEVVQAVPVALSEELDILVLWLLMEGEREGHRISCTPASTHHD